MATLTQVWSRKGHGGPLPLAYELLLLFDYVLVVVVVVRVTAKDGQTRALRRSIQQQTTQTSSQAPEHVKNLLETNPP